MGCGQYGWTLMLQITSLAFQPATNLGLENELYYLRCVSKRPDLDLVKRFFCLNCVNVNPAICKLVLCCVPPNFVIIHNYRSRGFSFFFYLHIKYSQRRIFKYLFKYADVFSYREWFIWYIDVGISFSSFSVFFCTCDWIRYQWNLYRLIVL